MRGIAGFISTVALGGILFARLSLATVSIGADGLPLGWEDRYLVKIRPGTTEPIRNAEFQRNGLRPVKFFRDISVAVAEIEDRSLFETGGYSRLQRSPLVVRVEPNAIVHADFLPNDPFWPQQYTARRLNLERAWDLGQGSYDVIAAVTDTGINFGHWDLRKQLWTNPREKQSNGKDNDGNGYVNDWRGWDFFSNDNYPWDENDHGHGTHVAGILGGQGNNHEGIAGVAWKVRIMPLRFLGVTGNGTLEGGIEAILYATNNGARIINASWGESSPTSSLTDAVNYAYSKGVLFVAAAGNDGHNTDREPHFPSCEESPNVISVASSEDVGKLSGFSNFGVTTVDVVAPGTKILSSVPDNEWTRLSGTSMATPAVSGVAVLILGKMPGLSVIDLRNAVLNAVQERPAYVGKIATAGDLDAAKALEQLDGGFQIWPARMTLKIGKPFQFTAWHSAGAVEWSVSDSNIAAVDQHGVVTFTKAGEVSVSARDASGKVAATVWTRGI